jgi:hypothetical protein
MYIVMYTLGYKTAVALLAVDIAKAVVCAISDFSTLVVCYWASI